MSSYLFIRSSTNPGPRVSRIMRFFVKNNKKVVYLSPTRSGDLADKNYRNFGYLGNYEYFDGTNFISYFKYLVEINIKISKKIFKHRSSIKLVHFSDLETVILGGLICKLLNINFIYNIHDNFFQRYEFMSLVANSLKYLEVIYILLSSATLVPEIFRKNAYPRISHEKIVIFKNYPDYDVSAEYIPFSKRIISLFYGGWISENRHIDQYLDLAQILKKHNYPVSLVVCGWGDEEYLVTLKKQFQDFEIDFVYLGQISQEECITHLKNADISIAFYNPNKVINLLAASNKIPEIIGSSTILITNNQTEIAKKIEGESISLQFKDNLNEIENDLIELIEDKKKLNGFMLRAEEYYKKEYSPFDQIRVLKDIFSSYM